MSEAREKRLTLHLDEDWQPQLGVYHWQGVWPELILRVKRSNGETRMLHLQASSWAELWRLIKAIEEEIRAHQQFEAKQRAWVAAITQEDQPFPLELLKPPDPGKN